MISIHIKRFFAGALLASMLLFPLAAAGSVSAADVFSGAKEEACAGVELKDTDGADCTANDSQRITNLIKNIIDLISIVVGVICVIVIIIGGFRFITSAGDSNGITSARNTIIYAIVGLIIVAFAQFIVKLVLSKISS